MFNVNVSAIPTTGCNVLSATTIVNYTGNNSQSRTFTLINNKYIQTGQSPSASTPNNAYCQPNPIIIPFNMDLGFFFLGAVLCVLAMFAIIVRWFRK
ncbi:hypothetical protein FWH58_02095 [Candidatus Saccharibacteria bacterium]|nr:hypothetical protein [Candidatus Saccharibacteria bacterium]